MSGTSVTISLTNIPLNANKVTLILEMGSGDLIQFENKESMGDTDKHPHLEMAELGDG